MTDTVRDAIAASLALETRIVSTPTEPFGWGSDVSCAASLDPDMRELAGDDQTVLAQAIIRRLDTPRGQLPDDGEYGLSLRDMLSTGLTDSTRRSIAGRVHNELIKDDRLDTVSVVVESGVASELTLTITVTPVEGDPFRMVLAASATGVIIEAIA